MILKVGTQIIVFATLVATVYFNLLYIYCYMCYILLFMLYTVIYVIYCCICYILLLYMLYTAVCVLYCYICFILLYMLYTVIYAIYCCICYILAVIFDIYSCLYTAVYAKCRLNNCSKYLLSHLPVIADQQNQFSNNGCRSGQHNPIYQFRYHAIQL